MEKIFLTSLKVKKIQEMSTTVSPRTGREMKATFDLGDKFYNLECVEVEGGFNLIKHFGKKETKGETKIDFETDFNIALRKFRKLYYSKCKEEFDPQVIFGNG